MKVFDLLSVRPTSWEVDSNTLRLYGLFWEVERGVTMIHPGREESWLELLGRRRVEGSRGMVLRF